jgi:hypothetical protein
MKNSKIKPLFIVLSCILLSSFVSYKWGGEGFEIYLNNKLVVQKFGNNMQPVTNLSLNNIDGNDVLKVRYYHCGRIGKNRSLIIKDGTTVLKTLHFADASQPATFMTFRVKELWPLQKKSQGNFTLYYSSSELSEGRLLAMINTGKRDVTLK